MDISEKSMSAFFGYSSIEEYYEETQPAGKLHAIRVPTLFLNSIDDPTMSEKLNPYHEFENNPHILGAFTKKGGHCAHFSGNFLPYQWFPVMKLEFLNFLEEQSKNNTSSTDNLQVFNEKLLEKQEFFVKDKKNL